MNIATEKELNMILEAFKNVKKINGFSIIDMVSLKNEKPEIFLESGQMDYKIFEKDIRPNYFIYVRHDVNSLSFTMDEKKENGVNVDTIIAAAMLMIQKGKPENDIVLKKLEEVITLLA